MVFKTITNQMKKGLVVIFILWPLVSLSLSVLSCVGLECPGQTVGWESVTIIYLYRHHRWALTGLSLH